MRSVPAPPDGVVTFQPILDVARGIAAGYRTVGCGVTTESVALTTRAALAAFATLPTNTFISIPIPLAVISKDPIRRQLREHGSLSGIVLDVTEFTGHVAPEAERALAEYRQAGAQIAVGESDSDQPELRSIVRLRPAIIRLGPVWVRGIDQSAARRSAIEVTGQLAKQLDAWILADGVSTQAELRTLAEIEVPLAQGALIGRPQVVWPAIELTARAVLPFVSPAGSGGLRELIQPAHTTRGYAVEATIPPEASEFDIVVVIDDRSRPVSLLHNDAFGRWEPSSALVVTVDCTLADAVAHAISRPRSERFFPLVCTDATGRFLGILHIERLMSHLAALAS